MKQIIIFVVILLCYFFISHYYQIIIVDGTSMEPTYHNHQLLICNKQRKINSGDIVVFDHDGVKIKRIIATAGEQVQLAGHKVYVNQVKISPYTSDSNALYQLENNQYFVIGDNYQNSLDSRSFGLINTDEIQCSIPK